jgi:hypothetical protein
MFSGWNSVGERNKAVDFFLWTSTSENASLVTGYSSAYETLQDSIPSQFAWIMYDVITFHNQELFSVVVYHSIKKYFVCRLNCWSKTEKSTNMFCPFP